MAQKIQNVILAGGSGNIGAAILSKLLSSGSFKVSVLSRLESKAVFPAEVKVHQVDYSYSSLVEAFQGQDAVVTALAHDAWPQQIPMIDAAVAAGVKRFIPSEYGSNTLNAKSIALVAPELDIKVATLEYLKKQESTGLTWTGIATGAFFDWGIQFGLFGLDINKQSALVYDGGNRPFSVTNLSQVANAVVGVLSKPTETANQFIYVDSFTASQNQMLAVLERATAKTWDVTHLTTESAIAEGKAALAEGDHAGFRYLMHASFVGEGFAADYTRDARLANEMLGLPKQGLEASVQALVEGKPLWGDRKMSR